MAVIDSYSSANQNTSVNVSVSNPKEIAQSFTVPSDNYTLDTVQFFINKQGTPPGTVVAIIYAHSGTYGASGSVPTGSALATSDAITATTLPTSLTMTTFTFSGANKITLSANTNYFAALQYNDAGSSVVNCIIFGIDTATITHSGRTAQLSGSWSSANNWDSPFSVNGTVSTGLAVTTNSVTSITKTTASGNGDITIATTNADERGIVYSTSTQAAPGNVAPGSSGYSGLVNETGSFSTGAFTESLTGLSPATRYYARAYAHNTTDGYIYGSEVNFITGLEVAWFIA